MFPLGPESSPEPDVIGTAGADAHPRSNAHPLAKHIGAWPAVAVVTAVTVAASELVTCTAAR